MTSQMKTEKESREKMDADLKRSIEECNQLKTQLESSSKVCFLFIRIFSIWLSIICTVVYCGWGLIFVYRSGKWREIEFFEREVRGVAMPAEHTSWVENETRQLSAGLIPRQDFLSLRVSFWPLCIFSNQIHISCFLF